MNNFGIMLDEYRTARLVALAELMECSPEDVIYSAIDTMWLEMKKDDDVER